MRIRRLDLIAFGHFTDLTLDLSASPTAVQLIYGRNEAGKSTALRALRALLYGIEARSNDNFLHEHTALRLGTVIERADGTLIDFIRRKGNRNTFLNRAGAPADDAPLRTALAAVDEALFLSLFGINHERLVAGGKQLLQAGGEVGESLFAAGFGGVSLRNVQAKLEEEAAALFKPRGENQLINQACRLFKDARDLVTQHSLPSRNYEECAVALATLRQERDAITAELQHLRRENKRLERIGRALPLLAARRELLTSLSELGEVPALPDDFSEQRVSACAALETGRVQARASADQLAAIDTQLATLSTPAALLAKTDLITDLYQRLGGHLKAARDLPSIQAELRTLEKDSKRLLQDLKIADPEASRLSRASQRQIQRLVTLYQTLQDAAFEAGKRRLAITAELDAQRAEFAQFADVSALRDGVADAQRRGDLEEELDRRRAAGKLAEAAAGDELHRLPLFGGTLAELVLLRVPGLETIDRFEKVWLAAETARTQSVASAAGLKAKSAEHQRKMAELVRAGPVPTSAEVTAARNRRDDTWRGIRQSWLDEAAPTVERQPLANTYENEVRTSDVLADQLRREASRVAEYDGLTNALADLDAESASIEEQAKSAQAAWLRTEADWRNLWPFDPLPPREMRAWLLRRDRLVEQFEDLRELHDATAETERRVAEHRAVLMPHLPAQPVRMLRKLVAEGALLVKNADLLVQNIAKLAQDLDVVTTAKMDAEAKLAVWHAEWQTATKAIGRDSATGTEEALEFIGDCAGLQEKIAAIDRLRARVRAIENDASHFEREAAGLSAELHPNQPARPADQTLRALYSELTRAREDAATLAALTKQRAELVQSLQQMQRSVEEAGSRLAAMCRQAGCEEVAHLETIERRTRTAQNFRRELANLDDRLKVESAGISLERFITQTETSDPDQISIESAENERILAEREKRQQELAAAIGSQESVLRQMDGNGRALDAAEVAQSVLAQIEQQSERFIRLKLAAVILRRQIEDYRAKNQSPLIARASEHFTRLTTGSFDAVAVEFDENDQPVIVAVRSTGQRVRMDFLSDGTRDQLFLALKLATVERFIAQSEPMPFIVDDVLIGFDHEREAAVLAVLAELARHTQVIVLTHHRHLVELAERELRDAVRVHNLDTSRARSQGVPENNPVNLP